MAKSPTLILCHGAWHTPEYWYLIKKSLESKGYKCVTPRLLFNDTEKPITALTPAIAALQDIIASEVGQGNDVVMVNHSFAGIVGCSAIKGFTRKDPSSLASSTSGHVVGMVLVPAFAPMSGGSLVDEHTEWARSNPDTQQVALPVETSREGWAELIVDPAPLFYNDLSPEDGAKWVSKLVKFAAAAVNYRDSTYAGWLDVPVWYVLCTMDMAMPLRRQEFTVEKCRKAGARVTTRELEAGHSPMLSKPRELVTLIEDAVRTFA